MTSLNLSDVSKSFGPAIAVDHVSLHVPSGEFVALLGPSGCGKTTLLRLIAGLERPDGGEIALDGEAVAAGSLFVDPEDRHLGMVFQSYALWPTMTVAGNIGFGLKQRGMKRSERDARVGKALAMVGLSGLGGRRPAQLSGGQRQRAALARCLALSPRLILLDEPLANLDAHLRAAMLDEFRRIHRETGATFVFVTHDQTEAMALADRVVVMDHGRIEQAGTPEALYAEPASRMVAGFIGEGALVSADVAPGEDGLVVHIGGARVAFANPQRPGRHLASVRPEAIRLAPSQDGGAAAVVASCTFRGGHYAIAGDLADGGSLIFHASRRIAPGEMVRLAIDRAWLLQADA